MEKETVRIKQQIKDPKIQEELWQIYQSSFKGFETRCAQNQSCYDERTFKAALMDPDYFKYYLVDEQGHAVAYMLSTNDLQKASITYMNPERYMTMFPDFAPDKIYYCTSLAVVPGSRSQRFFYRLMSAYLRHILVELQAMHAFDFSHETIPNLPEVLIKIGRRLYKEGALSSEFEYRKVGAQEFGALVPKKHTP